MMKKLKGGYLIRDMLDHFKEKINVTLKPDRSLWLYSAHDLTLAIALNTLNLYDVNIDTLLINLTMSLILISFFYFSDEIATVCEQFTF